MKKATRRRLPADESRRRILEAAERRLIADGPDGVRVQLVARDVGLTDAAVHHHFGSRRGLLEALLRYGGRRLRDEVEAAVAGWDEGEADLAQLAELIAEPYGRKGYARLALWLRLSGWRERGDGMLAGLVEAVHAARVEAELDAAEADSSKPPGLEESQFLVALFHLIQVAEPLFGDAMQRSAGLTRPGETRERFRAFATRSIERLMTPG